MSEFHIGQEVVCVDDGPPRGEFHFRNRERFPVLRVHYTIRNFDEFGGVRTHEIINPVALYKQGVREISFHPERFAPIKSETIEVFRKMCRAVSKNVNA